MYELQKCFCALRKHTFVFGNPVLQLIQEPLRNSINMSTFLASNIDKTSQQDQPLYAIYGPIDAMVFSDFRLNPQMLSFPWYDSDAHIGVLLGGLGMRLAAVMFYDYVQRADKESDSRYLEMQRCLLPNTTGGTEVLDKDLLGAVAAASVIWDVYREATATGAYGWSLHEPLPSYTADQLAFAFACWLYCGDTDRGPLMCNTPVMHSRDFGSVFECPLGALMNPVEKCQMKL